MNRQIIQANSISTLSWSNNILVDWTDSGKQYFPNDITRQRGIYRFTFPFDSAITSDDGIYAVIYQKLGTKGLLLKNGEILREINRSFYQAEIYEYPVAFATLKDGRSILIHCPEEYCRIDFEDIETGIKLTSQVNREPTDFFHSRFEISSDNKTLLSKGWAWHPFDFIIAYDIEECLANPLLLDKKQLSPDVNAEICSASFITSDLILIGSPMETELFDSERSGKFNNGHIGIWDIKKNTVSDIVQLKFQIGGHLVAINEELAWELYDYPKIINYKTGEIVDKISEIQSGNQVSSIIHHLENLPIIAFNKNTKDIAICADSKINILSK